MRPSSSIPLNPHSALAILAFALLLALGASASSRQEQEMVRQGDAVITGFKPFKLTPGSKGGHHFVFTHAPGRRIHLESKKKGLTADSDKVEGDVSGQNVLENATFSGGVRIDVLRPSAAKDNKALQTATATGNTAVYTEASNNLHVEGNVVIDDQDPGTHQSIHATGTSADLLLTPQTSKEMALVSGTIHGPVSTEIKGLRVEKRENGKPDRKVPFTLHSKSDTADFDYQARTLTLTGHIHLITDDPTLPESNYPGKEVIHLNADGSIDSVEGEGELGTDTVDLGGAGHL